MVKNWLRNRKVETLFIEPSIPWENGYIESFNGKLRDECFDGELFLCLTEAKYIVDRWWLDYNHHMPHSMLDCMTPAAYAASCPVKGVRVFLRSTRMKTWPRLSHSLVHNSWAGQSRLTSTKIGQSGKDDKYLNCKMLRP